jgi:hypothetical protein
MQPEIKSITIYVRQEQLDSFMRGENYNSLVWTITPGDPYAGGFFSFKQVQMQVSLDTYYKLVDAQGTVDENMETDNQLEFPFEL